ncbi:hypothetical protein Zmor_005702 [Zophobas morio]|uniref:RNA-directed DNA polymerase n=1 Tax=Zophobas morio TaxID=2755281 RepID=A0AA38IWE8_9CUCU|nr:hypothetical protein Zmor_005702 [Zophobas morio]
MINGLCRKDQEEDESPSLKALWAQWDSLHVENGFPKPAWESLNERHVTIQLVVPAIRTKKALQEMHNQNSSAHFGINKTLSKVRERFHWVRGREDVGNWCKKCTTCAVDKRPKIRARGLMQSHNVGSPFGRTAGERCATRSGWGERQ